MAPTTVRATLRSDQGVVSAIGVSAPGGGAAFGSSPFACPEQADAAQILSLGDGEPLVFDGVLGPATSAGVRRAVLEAARRGELRGAGIGRSHERRADVRSDRSTWVQPGHIDARLRPLMEEFERLRVQLSRQAYLGLRRFETQLALYERGDRYQRHTDAFVGAASRRLTAIYYANPQWSAGDGGELVCWRGAARRVIEPVADRLVLFLSEVLEHEVRRVERGRRVAVTAWFWGP